MAGKDSDIKVFSETKCIVGEGPIWHPHQNRLYWFDILGQAMFSSDGTDERRWTFDGVVSAAGIVDAHRLLIAGETGLSLFDTRNGTHERYMAIEADAPERRSNDGRTDRQGGFWFSTMGKSAEPGGARIYRFWRGEVRLLFEGLTIPNSICFSPDGGAAYFSDTPDQRVQKVSLDLETGWPDNAPETFLDLRKSNLNPDGAITDARGNIWIACWGDGTVRCHDPSGAMTGRVAIDTPNASCPAIGGVTGDQFFITSATFGLDEAAGAEADPAGKTFSVRLKVPALREGIVAL